MNKRKLKQRSITENMEDILIRNQFPIQQPLKRRKESNTNKASYANYKPKLLEITLAPFSAWQ